MMKIEEIMNRINREDKIVLKGFILSIIVIGGILLLI